MGDPQEKPSDINPDHEPLEETQPQADKKRGADAGKPLSAKKLPKDGKLKEKKKSKGVPWKRELYMLGGMMAIALGGMALCQASEPVAWEYWIFAVVAFCGAGIYTSSSKARRRGLPIRPIVIKHLLHWAGLLFILKVMVIMERLQFLDRQSAADASLLLLALACYLAGIHLNKMFLFLSVVIAVMVVVLVTLLEYAMLIWFIMIPIVAAGLYLFYRRSRKKAAAATTSKA
ncbi:hypothetical protein OAF27_00925 [Verrucomicrobiales bacterium]|nr:hypothetical protein [Verrucomicrobiales bacterium]